MGFLDGSLNEGVLQRDTSPPHLNLENFIFIHLIHSSGPEPGGQYAVTTCPIRGAKRRSPQGLKQRC